MSSRRRAQWKFSGLPTIIAEEIANEEGSTDEKETEAFDMEGTHATTTLKVHNTPSGNSTEMLLEE